MKALRRILYQLIIGAISLMLVVRGPISRFFSTAQALGLAYFGINLTILVLRNHKVKIRSRVVVIIVVICGLWAVFTLSLLFGSLCGATDFHQGIRDWRDYSVFAVMAVACIIDSNAYQRSPLHPLMIGGGLGIALELATRGTTFYSKIFCEPFLGYRYVAGFSSPNEYGAFCSIVLAMAIGKGLQTQSLGEAVGLLGLSAVVIVACISTFSRGSLLGAGIAVCVMFAFSIRDEGRNGKNLGWFKRLTILLVLIIAAVAVIGTQTPAVSSRDWRSILRYRLQYDIRSADMVGRIALINESVQIGAEYPVIGAGLGAFSAQHGAHGASNTISPHNELLKSFAEAGTLGLLFNAILFLLVIVHAFSVRQFSEGYAALGSALAFVVAEQFFSHLVRPALSIMFALIIGAVSVIGGEESCD